MPGSAAPGDQRHQPLIGRGDEAKRHHREYHPDDEAAVRLVQDRKNDERDHGSGREENEETAIAQALKHDGPALVEVLVSRQELSMPPTITYEQAKNFGLFMLKAVLSGRGDEIIDLARVNLLR